jgi:hypothetical protein
MSCKKIQNLNMSTKVKPKADTRQRSSQGVGSNANNQ